MKKTICCFAISAMLMLAGCAESENAEDIRASRDVFAMDTYMSLKAYGSSADEALGLAVEEIMRLEELLSVTKEGSDISAVNNSEGKAVSVESDTAEIIETALMVGAETEGALDITIYPILREWGFTTGEYKIPDKESLDGLLKYVDYRQIELTDGMVKVPEGCLIDLGALAKGYTSDRVMDILRADGVSSAVISLGGNVHTMGKKPDGSLWKVAVTDPFSPDSAMGVLEVTDKAVITSGNYERYFIGEDGKKYCHIIDSSSGYPAESGLVSVTIVGESGIMCDALSTALFVSGKERAEVFWQEWQEAFDMILVTEEHKIFITEGISSEFENLSGMELEVIGHES